MLNLAYMSSTPPPANHMFHCRCVLPDFSFVPLKSWEVLDGSFIFVCVCGGVGSTTRVGVCFQSSANKRSHLRPSLPFSGAAPVVSMVSIGRQYFLCSSTPSTRRWLFF